jgi:hypothetical protein
MKTEGVYSALFFQSAQLTTLGTVHEQASEEAGRTDKKADQLGLQGPKKWCSKLWGFFLPHHPTLGMEVWQPRDTTMHSPGNLFSLQLVLA